MHGGQETQDPDKMSTISLNEGLNSYFLVLNANAKNFIKVKHIYLLTFPERRITLWHIR